MQSTKKEYSKKDYFDLIEYIKWDFMEWPFHGKYGPEEYESLKKEVEFLFEIHIIHD